MVGESGTSIFSLSKSYSLCQIVAESLNNSFCRVRCVNDLSKESICSLIVTMRCSITSTLDLQSAINAFRARWSISSFCVSFVLIKFTSPPIVLFVPEICMLVINIKIVHLFTSRAMLFL